MIMIINQSINQILHGIGCFFCPKVFQRIEMMMSTRKTGIIRKHKIANWTKDGKFTDQAFAEGTLVEGIDGLHMATTEIGILGMSLC